MTVGVTCSSISCDHGAAFCYTYLIMKFRSNKVHYSVTHLLILHYSKINWYQLISNNNSSFSKHCSHVLGRLLVHCLCRPQVMCIGRCSDELIVGHGAHMSSTHFLHPKPPCPGGFFWVVNLKFKKSARI